VTARAIPLPSYDVAAVSPPTIAYEGSETFGVPRWPVASMSVGARYRLVPLTDDDAWQLTPGEPLVVLTAAGLRGVFVARARESGGWPVVDARGLDGRCLTYAPGDLYEVEVIR
jgi:hypothetical protein